eukprot:CAMPEP_0206464396 /NCGR_PEP_ID=MMETSP0324_2-20121206/27191_1 /ASSEMBLY_ACC=CAM_ASM_000836 /TAXON_ID=2866 /ORGANISM="Crypthecodinium cohnii, Strain Seligo" /LENGTH=310 /DNA_ID=CAMNT_0053937019 /DNA_START=132 /DNA_END=1064 /DNA_ORIENTATION=-
MPRASSPVCVTYASAALPSMMCGSPLPPSAPWNFDEEPACKRPRLGGDCGPLVEGCSLGMHPADQIRPQRRTAAVLDLGPTSSDFFGSDHDPMLSDELCLRPLGQLPPKRIRSDARWWNGRPGKEASTFKWGPLPSTTMDIDRSRQSSAGSEDAPDVVSMDLDTPTCVSSQGGRGCEPAVTREVSAANQAKGVSSSASCTALVPYLGAPLRPAHALSLLKSGSLVTFLPRPRLDVRDHAAFNSTVEVAQVFIDAASEKLQAISVPRSQAFVAARRLGLSLECSSAAKALAVLKELELEDGNVLLPVPSSD